VPSQISCGFFEIYKDEIYDLLKVDARGQTTMLQHGSGRIQDRHLATLTEVPAPDFETALRVLSDGQDKRRFAPMPLNPVSSRSHGIFKLVATRTYPDKTTSKASLFFVDLMGSEAMVSEAGAATLEETTSINHDLLCLGRVVTSLSKNTVAVYRECTLTYILRDLLGGNAKCSILVTASPHIMQYHCTENTLRFGERCKGIERSVTSDRRKLTNDQLENLVRQLQQELAHEKEKVESSEYAAKTAEREVIRMRQERIEVAEVVASKADNSALQMQLVEEQNRYQSTAAERDRLRSEVMALKKEAQAANEEMRARAEKAEYRCEKLDATREQLSKEVAELRIENNKLRGEAERLEKEFSEKMRVQEHVEVQMKSTMGDLMRTRSEVDQATRVIEKKKQMQQTLEDLLKRTAN